MAGLGVFIAWLGYSVAYFGVDQIRGGNNGLIALMKPGVFTEQQPDGGPQPAAGATTGGTGSAVKTPGNPSGVSVWNATSAPKGAPPGKYRVNQDGTIQKQTANGGWMTYQLPGQTSPLQAT